jgi:adenylate cyclase
MSAKHVVFKDGAGNGIEQVAAGANAANTALFELDFTRPHAPADDEFDIVAVRAGCARARNGVVLVVDGDASAGEHTAELLRAEGWHVVVQGNPREAARTMSRLGKPALLVLEAELPHMGGIEFLQRLRANRHVKETPVVILAARATRADLAHAFESGADGYVSKSAGDARVAAALRALLGATGQG